jgi:hypothetical protein
LKKVLIFLAIFLFFVFPVFGFFQEIFSNPNPTFIVKRTFETDVNGGDIDVGSISAESIDVGSISATDISLPGSVTTTTTPFIDARSSAGASTSGWSNALLEAGRVFQDRSIGMEYGTSNWGVLSGSWIGLKNMQDDTDMAKFFGDGKSYFGQVYGGLNDTVQIYIEGGDSSSTIRSRNSSTTATDKMEINGNPIEFQIATSPKAELDTSGNFELGSKIVLKQDGNFSLDSPNGTTFNCGVTNEGNFQCTP